MNNICKLCVHSDIDVKAHPCNDCGDDFSMFKFDIEQQLQQAHRQGWEQCKKEAFEIARTTQIGQIQTTIAAMEYKEAEDE